MDKAAVKEEPDIVFVNDIVEEEAEAVVTPPAPPSPPKRPPRRINTCGGVAKKARKS